MIDETTDNNTVSDNNNENNNIENQSPVKCECDEVSSKCLEYKTGWLRAQADYQNLVRETNERRLELIKMSKLSIIEDFLPVYTNFRTAFSTKVSEDQWLGWKQGIEHIMTQYREILKSYDVKEISTVGEKFDPTLHEAVGEEESEGESDVVLREVTTGYKMGDKVVQVARVIVSK